MYRCFLIVCLAMFHSALAFAGAWNMPKGKGQTISMTTYSTSDTAFTSGEFADAPVDFTKTESRIFAEHGLTQKITLVGNIAYQTVGFQGLDSSINYEGFDKTELGLRYQIKRREGLAVAVQASYVIGGGPKQSILDIDGRKDVFELRGLWGQSFDFGDKHNNKWVGFFDVHLAARARSTERLEDWRADLTLGLKPNEKMFIMVQGFHIDRFSFSKSGFTVPRQSQSKAQISAVFEFKENRWLQFSYLETLAGRNIVKEQAFTVGLWQRY